MKPLLRRLAALDPRLSLLLMCAIGFLVAFQSWVFLRAPIAELQLLTATRARLQSVAARDAGSAAEVERLSREQALLDKGLGGGLLRSDDAMVPFLLTSLDATAARHGVSLGGVKPPAQRALGSLEELSYSVEARGGYQPLFAWLDEALRDAEPLVATEFSMKSIDEGQRVALTVRLAAYRMAGAASAATFGAAK